MNVILTKLNKQRT